MNLYFGTRPWSTGGASVWIEQDDDQILIGVGLTTLDALIEAEKALRTQLDALQQRLTVERENQQSLAREPMS